jgi:N,N'-diacetyllegionaminate synthase
MTRTLVIAEAGVNHNGDLELARRLIDAAADAGADIVKFQTFKADRVATRAAGKAEYQDRTTGSGESQQQMLRRLELTRPMHEQLIAHAKERNIEFLSTGFDLESVDLLAELGMARYKIPSGEITNVPYLRHIARIGKPIILSTGMASLGEVESAVETLEACAVAREQLTVLHCNTEYPTPMRDVNLRAMLTIGQALGVAIGYSDHTLGAEVAVSAVALGATVIEKHIALDRSLPGPDQEASLEPREFKAMVDAIRNIELALGDGVKRASPSELKNRPVVRRSIVAARDIRAGERFTAENLTAKRPGTGISPTRWDDVIGRAARRDFTADELIEL